MHTSKLSIAILITAALCATTVIAAPRDQQLEAPQRLVSIAEQGGVVTLRLANGRSVDVPASAVMVREERASGATRQSNRSANAMPDTATSRKQGLRGTNLSEIASLSRGAVPAAVKIRYAPDGTVRRAKITVFESEAAADAFIAASSRRARAGETRSPNQ